MTDNDSTDDDLKELLKLAISLDYHGEVVSRVIKPFRNVDKYPQLAAFFIIEDHSRAEEGAGMTRAMDHFGFKDVAKT